MRNAKKLSPARNRISIDIVTIISNHPKAKPLADFHPFEHQPSRLFCP
jgi:formyltetrahydrofolate hydrolase